MTYDLVQNDHLNSRIIGVLNQHNIATILHYNIAMEKETIIPPLFLCLE
jgi:hypothetical protein